METNLYDGEYDCCDLGTDGTAVINLIRNATTYRLAIVGVNPNWDGSLGGSPGYLVLRGTPHQHFEWLINYYDPNGDSVTIECDPLADRAHAWMQLRQAFPHMYKKV